MKKKQLNCFLTEEEHSIMVEMAKKNGLTISSYIRFIIAQYKNNKN